MGKFGTPFKLDQLPPAMRAQAERELAVPSKLPTVATPAAAKGKAPDERTKRLLAVKFEGAWESMEGAPAYATEVQVAPDRQWKYDYCWIEAKVALELQGGIYMAGKGHVNPKQFRSDCDKLNYSNTVGVVVFKFATGQITAENLVMLRFFIGRRLQKP